jgi:hypothetical protein
MTDEQFQTLINRLDMIISLLMGETEPVGCPHENAEDLSTMGQAPGTTMHCQQCGVYFSRK